MERPVPHATAILVVDVQERLAAAMPKETLDRLVANVGILVEAAKTLGVHVLASEQYPKGLGPTLSAIAEKLPSPPLAKMTFDACSDLAIARALESLAPRTVIVAGMEAHVCVFQTARELVKRGHQTIVLADAVSSRREENRVLGLSLCERAGAAIAPTETVLFDLLERAGTDAFKTVSKLVR
ncbi:MAG TPA: isochorismatase family protein [Labilithrix sp.]|jgi:nicotinamidase-related amidase